MPFNFVCQHDTILGIPKKQIHAGGSYPKAHWMRGAFCPVSHYNNQQHYLMILLWKAL